MPRQWVKGLEKLSKSRRRMTSLGASARDGDFLNDSVGMSNLSTVKR